MTLKTVASTLLSLWMVTYALGITKLGLIPAKLIITITYIFIGLSIFLLSRKAKIHQIHLLLAITFGILTALIVGISNGFLTSTIGQLTSIIASFLMVILTIELIAARQIDIQQIKNSIYFAAIIGILSKLSMVVMIVSGLISADSVNNLYQGFFGGSADSIHANRGFMSILPRFGNAGDLFYIVVFVFMINDFKGKKLFTMWLLTFSVVLISYSRYLMACFSFISLLLLIWASKKNPITIFGSLATITILAINFIDFSSVYLEIVERYTGQIQLESDSIRLEMTNLLYSEFEKNMLLGIGLGGHIEHYIRSDTNLWMYETEYLALLMQLGIVGFTTVVIGYIAYILRQMFHQNPNKNLYIQTCFCMIILLALPIQSALFVGTQFSATIISIFILTRNTEFLRETIKKNLNSKQIPPASIK